MISDLTPEQLKLKYEPKPVKQVTSERQLTAARFTPCGTRILAGGYDAMLRLWDFSAEQPTELASSAEHRGWVQGLALHPTEKVAYTADSWGRLQEVSYLEDSLIVQWHKDQAHDGWIRALAINPDASALVSVGRDQQVRVWNPADGTQLRQIDAHHEDVYACAFHPDGKQFVSGDAKGTILHWSTEQDEPLGRFDASELFSVLRLQDVGGVHALLFSHDGKKLFVGGTRPKNGGNVQGTPLLLVFDVASRELSETIELGSAADVYVRHVEEHADGFLMATTSGNPGTGKLQFVRLGDEQPFYVNTALSNCHHVSIHPDGKQLAVTTTVRGSNGNGRPLKDGEYVGNHSPIHLLAIPESP